MKKGTFRKVLGMAAVVAAVGVIVMMVLSPRREGFCPELFTRIGGAVERPQPESVPVRLPETVPDSLPPSAYEAVSDTLTVE